MDKASVNFLKEHDIATFSTVDRDNNVHGATVYYIVGGKNQVYIVTKAQTQKVHDFLAHPQVALTVFDAARLQTVQMQGLAGIEADQKIKDFVFQQIIMSRLSAPGHKIPPVMRLREGSFMVIRIIPIDAKFRDFSKDKD